MDVRVLKDQEVGDGVAMVPQSRSIVHILPSIGGAIVHPDLVRDTLGTRDTDRKAVIACIGKDPAIIGVGDRST